MTSWASDRLDLFVVGTNSAVFHKWWDGQKWGPSVKDWENLGGTVIFDPVSVAWGPNRLDVFAIGTDSALYHKWWDGSSWGPSISGWEKLGGTWTEKPTVVSWGKNRLDIFLVGTDRSLYQKFWNGSQWNNGFVNLGGKFLHAPAAVAWGSDRLDIFGTGTNSAVFHKWWNGSAWGPSVADWENMGGTIVGPPKAVSWAPNRLDIFSVGLDSALYHKYWNGSNWGPSGAAGAWESLGGTIQRSPEIISWGDQRLDIFVIGTDNGVFHKWYDGKSGGWGPSIKDYERMGGIVINNLTAVSWASNRIDLFVVGTDGAIDHKAYSPSIGGWQPNGLAGGYENLGGIAISSVARDN